MPLIQTATLTLKNYRDGDRSAQVITPPWARRIRLTLQRCTTSTPTLWSQASTYVEVELEASADGGVTWRPAGGWGAYGGIHVRRDGTEASSSVGRFPCAGGGLVRVRFAIRNGPCRTSGDIQLTDG